MTNDDPMYLRHLEQALEAAELEIKWLEGEARERDKILAEMQEQLAPTHMGEPMIRNCSLTDNMRDDDAARWRWVTRAGRTRELRIPAEENKVSIDAAIDEALGIGADGCGDPDQTLTAIAELKSLQKMESKQLRKIHPLDFPIEVFLADLTTRPANIIRAELAGFASYAGTGTFDIEPPFTVRHLCMFSRSEMRKWPNFGRKCLNEVEEMLRARGLQLWENHDERSLRLLREHKEYFK